ncbi:hypothetical protein JQK88_10490 [Mesorhizobium caraganae]|nr:hypothetical protein [Mesorhizobium caraganae]
MVATPETRTPAAGQAAGASGDIKAGSVQKSNGNPADFQEKPLQSQTAVFERSLLANLVERLEGGA